MEKLLGGELGSTLLCGDISLSVTVACGPFFSGSGRAGTSFGERPDGAKVMTATGPLCVRSNVFKEGHGEYLHDNHILFKPCLEMRLLGGGPVGKGLYNQRTL